MEDVFPKKLCTNTKSSADKSKIDDKQTDLKKTTNEKGPTPLTYDIWRLVFKYLNGKDMCLASSVCKMWKDAFEKEMSLYGPVFMMPKLTDLVSEKGKKIVNELKIKPSACFCCCANLVVENFSLDKLICTKDCICKNVPPACDIVYTFTYDVFVNPKACTDRYSSETFKTGCMFFPHIPEAEIKVSYIKLSVSPKERIITHQLRKMGTELVHGGKDKSKCIIMFFTPECTKYISSILNHLTYKKHKQESLALIGGQTNSILVCKKGKPRVCKDRAACVAITLSRAGLEAWSAVVKRNCYKKEQIEAKLQDLKEKISLKRHTAGFMFACCARMDNKDIEVQAFTNVFPDIPLMCSFGDGEVGVDTIYDDPRLYPGDRPMYHQYSTVFLIITYP